MAGFGVSSGSNLRSRIIAGICFAVAFILFVLDFTGFREEPVVDVRRTVDGISVETLDVASIPGRFLRSVGTSIAEQFRLSSENDRLKQENEQLRFYQAQALDLQERIGHYEDILNAELSGSIFAEKIAGRSVSEFEGPFVRSALIDIGSRNGVRDGHPVLTSYGLYGRVVRTGPRSARVLLVTDLNSRIPVMSQRSRERALLVGDNTNIPVLDYLVSEEGWQIGDRVVTSGDGGELPRGLPVGEVISHEDEGLAVSLYIGTAPVDWIWVYPFEVIETPPDVDTEDTLEDQSATAPEGEGIGNGSE